ncbi:MAG: M20 family metallopeptidase [Planctomycetota bacterium]
MDSDSHRLSAVDCERIVPFELLLDRLVEEGLSDWIADRRFLHAHPELSGREVQTTAWIRERLERLGLSVRSGVRQLGCIADLVIGQPPVSAPLIALRADIDALPLQDRKATPYASTVAGLTHACGHDVHTTIVLGVCELFTRLAAQLPQGDVPGLRLRVIFQPAEETAEGAAWMVEAGALEGVDCILGLHVDPTLIQGRAGIRYGVLTACVDEVSLMVSGRGGHAARPQHSSDPLLTAAQLVTTLYQMLPRQADALYPTVFTIGSIHGGTVSNVIPDEVRLEGTLRTTNSAVRTQLMATMQRICDGLAEASGNSIGLQFSCPLGSVVNHSLPASAFEVAARQVVGSENVVLIDKPSMGGEDFAVYVERVPGAQFRLGCADGVSEWPLLHSPCFDIDERAIGHGLRIVARAALLLALQPATGC